MKSKILVAGLVCFCLLFTTGAYAVKFIRKAESGIRIYKCKLYYGDVKVIALEKGIYRVFSIPFSGELEASSSMEAAKAACKESKSPMKRVTKPLPYRNSADCD